MISFDVNLKIRINKKSIGFYFMLLILYLRLNYILDLLSLIQIIQDVVKYVAICNYIFAAQYQFIPCIRTAVNSLQFYSISPS